METARSFDNRQAEEGEAGGEAAAGRGELSAGSARYKLMSPAKLPISRSPCLTIPPGLSPSSFLESPVLLSNVKAEPSPTTGSFFKPEMMQMFGGSTTFSSIINVSSSMNGNKSSCFKFQPTSSSGSNSIAGLSMEGPLTSADIYNQQSEQRMQVQAQCLSHSFTSSAAVKNGASASNELSLLAPSQEVAPITTVAVETDSVKSNQNLLPSAEFQAPQSDHPGMAPSMNDRVSEDGYSWRKYGQKLVKGSEYPRSYYKCTHPNCEVRKLFERAPDGQITEIIYKGRHDHPKPQPNRRMPAGSLSIQEEQSDRFSSLAGQEDKPPTIPGQVAQNSNPNITPELSPCTADENILEGGVSRLNRHPEDADADADADEDPFGKRRKVEIDGVDINSVIKPIREPRVVVQTLSEVDILDDGYRWRKYGQKVVRGNPNPRSYYKCTSAGCPVRKHVERASHDPKAVITTYEGKHNHDVPTARTSAHDTTASVASRARQQDGETVSLDLGVGISSTAENTPNQHQSMDTDPLLGRNQLGSSNLLFLQAPPNSAYPGYLNGPMMMYGSRESRGEGIEVRNLSLNHSTYPPNIGRLLMGP